MRHLSGLGLVLVAALTSACGAVGSPPEDGNADAGAADACVPETSEELCTRLGRTCEAASGMDRCGVTRAVECGACSDGQGCVHGVCRTPLCGSLVWNGVSFPDLNQPDVQDDLLAATPDGATLVHVRSSLTCGDPFRVFVRDETAPGSGTFSTHEIPAGQLPPELVLFWGSTAITPDGLTVVSRRTDSKGFVTSSRSAPGLTDFGSADQARFAPLNESLAGDDRTVFGPTLSADGEEFFYSVSSADPLVAGLYVARRDATLGAYLPGTRLPDPAQGYEFVSGLSSDGLTLFVTRSFQTFVLSRPTTSGIAFANPNAPDAEPTVAGWSVVPFRLDCTQLVGIHSPGGCGNEDVFRYDLQ